MFTKQKIKIALNQEHLLLDDFIEKYSDDFDSFPEKAREILIALARWSGKRLKKINQ